ncbi:MAG: transcriptional regulator with AAA-type ATPase domain [Myxococcota bacterium]|jgi:transcriptional regulator with AAA-type ATPase domain
MLLRLTAALRDSTHFEPGAKAALSVILDEVADSLPGATVLRGMVHLRPGGAYQGLVVVERSGGGSAPDLVPSASAWQALSADPRPMIIDVSLARARTVGGELHPNARRLFSLRTTQTIARLRSRLTTLLLVLPLRGLDGTLLGTVSIELNTDATDTGPEGIDHSASRAAALADVLAFALPFLPILSSEDIPRDPLMPVIGRKMGHLLRLLGVFARQDETLLLSGATGVGKSQLAAWCHGRSLMRSGPLEPVVLSTLPEEMQLPSLFGWKRGAFTGASRDTPGAVARADGGTLFIDEIDKLSPRAQAGLLQLLESHQYRSVGDPGPLKTANVRFIIGTNTDLQVAVEEGRFLEDLFFRINVLPVEIPTLSERTDEVPDWVRFMLRRRHKKSGLPGSVAVSTEATELLAAQPWPGNLRQLNNAVRRTYAVALADLSGGAMTIQRSHVEQALSMDLARRRSSSSASPEGMLPSMEAACQAVLMEAKRRIPSEREQVFLLSDAFSALLLHFALQETGDLKAAYSLLGRDGLVASRSHHKDFRRRMGRLKEIFDALSLPMDPALLQSATL